jgi:hypothetical protein
MEDSDSSQLPVQPAALPGSHFGSIGNLAYGKGGDMQCRVNKGLNRFKRQSVRTALLVAVLLVSWGALASLAGLPAGWNPDAIATQDTIKLRTVGPREGEHWFPVWVVVLDHEVYVRLGSRATGRVEENTAAPYLGVEIAGQRFDKVRGVPAPESVQRVASAMARKYWTDIFVRYMRHPLTLRLVPEE